MLARNAESLYWIGRYVERADDTARILDVSVHQLLEDATVDADGATRILLGVLGVVPPDGDVLDAWSLTELVGYSADQPASIVSSVCSARENARGAREVVSAEMWECLNATWNALPERQRYARWVGPHAFFSYVEDRAAMLNGLAASTMSRDDTWRFYLLGRSVERVDMIVRLLMSRVSDRMSSPGWLTVLRSASESRSASAENVPRSASSANADAPSLAEVDSADGPIGAVAPPGTLGDRPLQWPSPVSGYGNDPPAWSL